ncbi:MAG TPA: choice-of-anchor tandem repeat GloVer-containing protein [Rhizomicrobium sp.]|nr:choice-of-anchor tandem repeat GloVer-containing protein [Rhizomicrobium sp.]
MNRSALAAVAGAFIFWTAFPVSPAGAATETVVYSFCSQIKRGHCRDGAAPNGDLMEANGTLYGTTGGGGACRRSSGTVFALDPKTGKLTTLHSFCDPATTGDGADPASALILTSGTLYGTTEGGGIYGKSKAGNGTVFSLDPATLSETVLYRFQGGTDGGAPRAGLIDVNGTLYGTTFWGGKKAGICTIGCGTVFSLDPDTGAEQVVYAFQDNLDGAGPNTTLVDVNGILYGTTQANNGTVFSFDPATGAVTTVYTFHGNTDGSYVQGGMVGRKHTLYGTTAEGGTDGYGIVYAIDLRTGAETVLHSFGGVAVGDGRNPYGRLMIANGMLYGTTQVGGSDSCGIDEGCGTVFSVDPSSGTETVLHAFGSLPDGQWPDAGLIDVKGTLYGTTDLGGAHNEGTVFAITP